LELSPNLQIRKELAISLNAEATGRRPAARKSRRDSVGRDRPTVEIIPGIIERV
jgi:hypothetical protein